MVATNAAGKGAVTVKKYRKAVYKNQAGTVQSAVATCGRTKSCG